MTSVPPIEHFQLASNNSMTTLSSYKGKPTVIHLYTSCGGCWPTSACMERWAKGKYKDLVNFICVSCAGPRMALAMGQESKFNFVTNGVITRQEDMPKWGQLGCNGLIILDEDHKVVLPKSSAFLQVNHIAFRHVEVILNAMLKGKDIPKICPGEYVRIELKGDKNYLKTGLVHELSDQGVLVQIGKGLGPGGKQFHFPAEHLTVISSEQAARELAASSTEEKTASSCSSGSSCHSGGCDDSPQETEEDSILIKAVPSVLNEEMDHEHEECIMALNYLSIEKSNVALQLCLQVLTTHFQSEEELLDRTIFKNLNKEDSLFNADRNMRTSHNGDHERILSYMKSCGSSKRLSTEQINTIINMFEAHAEKYDGAYAERLNAALSESKSS